MIRILLVVVTALTIGLGLAMWRIDHLGSQNELLAKDVAAATSVANENAAQVERLNRLRSNDAQTIGSLQRRYEDLHTDNLNLREMLKHEKDGPTAPVLKCAVDQRLCQSNGNNRNQNDTSNPSVGSSSMPVRTDSAN